MMTGKKCEEMVGEEGGAFWTTGQISVLIPVKGGNLEGFSGLNWSGACHMVEFHTVVRQPHHSHVTPSQATHSFFQPCLEQTLSRGHISKQERGPACREPQLGGQEHPVGIYGVPNVLGTEGSYLREEETELKRNNATCPYPLGLWVVEMRAVDSGLSIQCLV